MTAMLNSLDRKMYSLQITHILIHMFRTNWTLIPVSSMLPTSA